MSFGIKVFSKREREKRGETPDVYTYDRIPDSTRTKLQYWTLEIARASGAHRAAHSMEGRSTQTLGEAFLREAVYELCKTHGWEHLPNRPYGSKGVTDDVRHHIRKGELVEVLDFMEVVIQTYDLSFGSCQRAGCTTGWAKGPREAELELGSIFKEDGVGYESIQGQIVRIDSDFLHRESVREAFALLRAHDFDGPLQEFSSAVSERDGGDRKQAIAEANKALESVMKAILSSVGHPYDPDRDTAAPLISHLVTAGLLPNDMSTFANHVVGVLQSGVPGLRNRKGGHGQGATSVVVDQSYADLALHLAGSLIVFLIRRYEETHE